MEVISYFFENFYFQVKTAVTLTPFVKPHLGNLINSTKHPKMAHMESAFIPNLGSTISVC